MATASLGRRPSPSFLENKPAPPKPPPFLSSLVPCQCGTRLTSHFAPCPLLADDRRPGWWCPKPLLAFSGREEVASRSQEINGKEYWMRDDAKDYEGAVHSKIYKRPCVLYLCNLPRNFDIADIAKMFTPFGTITAVQVSINPRTGQSRGAAYVTMISSDDAKKAVAGLEGTDVGGREIRLRFSTEMRNSNEAEMNPNSRIYSIYQGPYQLYAGNLPWSTRPEDVWKIFREFGTVASVRLVNDRRTGKLRVYACVSYNTKAELEAALSMTRKSINGRQMDLRRFEKSDGSFYSTSAYP